MQRRDLCWRGGARPLQAICYLVFPERIEEIGPPSKAIESLLAEESRENFYNTSPEHPKRESLLWKKALCEAEKGSISFANLGESRRFSTRPGRETRARENRHSDPRVSSETPIRRRENQAHQRCTCKESLATDASPPPLHDLSTKDRSRNSNRASLEVSCTPLLS
ncbi:hypothetical protein VNO77_03659 [Canavalia gladiata]|uniref:Uncharacterized protein n=1 Tax=Canavalia gladiata TaxID=3824 RepID=A0AAN9MV96_CANGL